MYVVGFGGRGGALAGGVGVGKSKPEHGTRARYRAGCKCDACKQWKSDEQRRYRERRAAREGLPVPERRARPTTPEGTTRGQDLDPSDVVVDAEFERMTRREKAGPIEREVWALLESEDSSAGRLVREVVLRAAQHMDAPTSAAMFKAAADTMRAFIADNLATKPKGAGSGELATFLESLGGARRRGGGGAAVDDAAES